MVRVGIVGGTGYTGMELIRLLLGHPQAEIAFICSRSQAGVYVSDVFPHFAGKIDLRFTSEPDFDCDVVFFAAPNGVAMQKVAGLLERGIKVIDLAADFRLRDPELWEKWYKIPHSCPELLDQAVYGLPELYREQIKQASLIANPGCYPTSVLLGFFPLLSRKIVPRTPLIADVKSGVSGAGRKSGAGMILPELAANFKAYNASAHRHYPEIKQQLDAMSGAAIELSFTPHLIPVSRGIIATLYCEVSMEISELQDIFEQTYASEPFVKVLAAGQHPETRYVTGINECHIAVHKPVDSRVSKVLVAIDNLVKGAAGQAIQNMNLLYGLEETTGLTGTSVLP